MIIEYGTHRGQVYYGLGTLLLWDGDEEAVVVTPTLIGQWSNVIYLESSAVRQSLTATDGRQNLTAALTRQDLEANQPRKELEAQCPTR